MPLLKFPQQAGTQVDGLNFVQGAVFFTLAARSSQGIVYIGIFGHLFTPVYNSPGGGIIKYKRGMGR